MISPRHEAAVSRSTGADFTTRARGDLSWLYNSPESPMFCDGCHAILGGLHVLRAAFLKKKGAVYYVRCRSCGLMNKREKGKAAELMDERWKDFLPPLDKED